MSFPVRLWLATRIAVFTVAGLSVFLWPHLYTPTGTIAFDLGLGDALCVWDCREYAEIARTGYGIPIMTNFWPMLPVLARPLVWLHLSSVWAVIAVGNACALGAYVAIYRVFAMLDGDDAARWGLTLLACYPFAFFGASGFTEPVMMCAAAAAMYLALRGRHVWAGVALAGGVLSRMPATLAWLGLVAVQWRDRPLGWRTRLGLVIPVAFAALWPAYLWWRFGDPLMWMHVRQIWGWHGHTNVIKGILRWRQGRLMAVYPVIALAPVAGTLALLRERRWWPLAAFAVPQMALFLAIGAYGLGRYTSSVWPAFLPLGVWLARRPSLQTPVVIIWCLLQGLFLHLFAHSYEVQ